MHTSRTRHRLACWSVSWLVPTALVLAGCGSRAKTAIDAGVGGGGPNQGLAVGSPCTTASQCDSPTSPDCLTEIKPLKSVAGVPATIAGLGLVFPMGYCSSVLNCAADTDCGKRGACYRPFREVTAATLHDLESALGVTAGSLNFLPTYGVCLRSCASSGDCEVGQLCEPPLADLVSRVPGAINNVPYCVPDPACPASGCTAGPCSPNPCLNGGTCAPTGATTFACTCPSGYSGTTCQTVTMCPGLTAPTNGHVSVSSQVAGAVAQYECDTGYVLSGSATRTCQGDGTWTDSAPTCTAAPCASTPCQHGGVCTPGSGTSFTCSCSGTGYTGTTCATPVDCGALGTLTNGTITTAPASSTTFGTTATYACNGGYTLVGTATRTCQASGNWSGSAPTCMAQTANPCSPNPCLNGGTCSASGASFTCACTTGYSGATCQTPFDCGALQAPANGTVTAGSTTLGATATYACNANYTLTGAATRTCQATGWSGTAPTCAASSCGSYTDVIYRLTGTFQIAGTPFGAGDQTFTGLTNNASTPPFASTTNTTPFVGGGTFTRGFARLRFTNDAAGTPIAGAVRLIEWYMPLEFTQTNGATLYANNDHSVGILDNPGSLSNCGGGDATCSNHTPSVNRTCAANASGTLAGTALNWGPCTPAWSGTNSWSYVSARGVTGAGCATGYVQYGNNTTTSALVPASGKGDAYQVYNQQLAAITFSGTNYSTATWSMMPIQIPNGTGQSNTWLTITSATPIGTDCGTTPGVDLVCNVQ